MKDAIDAAIAELPEQQRMAVVLRRYEEMPYEEIARVLDLTVPAVKSLLFRARTFLRERLEKYLAQLECPASTLWIGERTRLACSPNRPRRC